jgi:hypothetical protein
VANPDEFPLFLALSATERRISWTTTTKGRRRRRRRQKKEAEDESHELSFLLSLSSREKLAPRMKMKEDRRMTQQEEAE